MKIIYDYQRRKPRTPSGRFLKHMADVFTKELERLKISKNEFYRHHALLVSSPTFNRLFDGITGAHVKIVADVADALGYELRLIPKSEISNEQDNENTD